jgi:uncharacterized protein YqeY
MKNGDHLKLSVWRAIKTEFVKFQTSGSNVELTDEKELEIIKKMVQQRKESAEIYANAGRLSLVDMEKSEMEILQSLLPNEPNEEEIIKEIDLYLKDRFDTPTMKELKDVIKHVKSKYPIVDGGLVSRIFKEKYIN